MSEFISCIFFPTAFHFTSLFRSSCRTHSKNVWSVGVRHHFFLYKHPEENELNEMGIPRGEDRLSTLYYECMNPERALELFPPLVKAWIGLLACKSPSLPPDVARFVFDTLSTNFPNELPPQMSPRVSFLFLSAFTQLRLKRTPPIRRATHQFQKVV